MDISDLKEILRILEAQDITEFELEQDGVKLRVCRASAAPVRVDAAPPAPAGFPASSAPAAPAAVAPLPAPEPAPDGTLVKSPIVGTFYRAPDPNSPPFVSVGDRVKVGQVLCIIEAMKLMNEIESDCEGEIVQVYVENGKPVQYGDRLFAVKIA